MSDSGAPAVIDADESRWLDAAEVSMDDAGALTLEHDARPLERDDELALAASSGALPARLTRSILRIETACVAAVAAVVMTFGK